MEKKKKKERKKQFQLHHLLSGTTVWGHSMNRDEGLNSEEILGDFFKQNCSFL